MYKILDTVPILKCFVCSLVNAVIWCHFRMCNGCSVERVRCIMSWICTIEQDQKQIFKIQTNLSVKIGQCNAMFWVWRAAEFLKGATVQPNGSAKIFRHCARLWLLNAKMHNLPLLYLFWVIFNLFCCFLAHFVCAKLLNRNIGRAKK